MVSRTVAQRRKPQNVAKCWRTLQRATRTGKTMLQASKAKMMTQTGLTVSLINTQRRKKKLMVGVSALLEFPTVATSREAVTAH
jgi:hypothetical protein